MVLQVIPFLKGIAPQEQYYLLTLVTLHHQVISIMKSQLLKYLRFDILHLCFLILHCLQSYSDCGEKNHATPKIQPCTVSTTRKDEAHISCQVMLS